ncbi:MAG: FG-GAP repeat domain-containing protein [Candidatus Brocadiia bacterium]
MREKSTPSPVNRLMAVVGVLLLLATCLGVGLLLPERQQTPVEVESSTADRGAEGMDEPLELTDPPQVVVKDNRPYLRWETSLPTDALITYGRSDPFRHVLLKDGERSKKHLHPLPEGKLARFYRFRIMGFSEGGRVVTRTTGPGRGPGGKLFSRVRSWKDTGPTPPAGASIRGPGSRDVLFARWSEEVDSPKLQWTDQREAVLRLPGIAPDGDDRTTPLQVTDLTGDGYGDFILARPPGRVLLNGGPPDYHLEPSPESDRYAGRFAMKDATVGDVDGDGYPDIVGVDEEGKVRVLLQDGTSEVRFVEHPASPLGDADASFSHVSLANVDQKTGDEILALGRSAVLWKLTESEEEQRVPVQEWPFAKKGLRAAASLQFRPDDTVELYVFGPDGGLWLLTNSRSAPLEFTAEKVSVILDSEVTSADAADVTGNGHADVIAGLESGEIVLLLDTGRGEFIDASRMASPDTKSGRPVAGLLTADFTGDGRRDLLVGRKDGSTALLENSCATDDSTRFLTVRPTGQLGVAGALVEILDSEGSEVLQAERVPTDRPPECHFLLQDITEALVRIRFSDGHVSSARWERGESDRPFVLQREK